jgi:hypothetical protein
LRGRAAQAQRSIASFPTMSRQLQEIKSDDNRVLPRGSLLVAGSLISADILRRNGVLAFPLNILLVYAIALPIDYWFSPPRPDFFKFLYRVFCLLLLLFIGMWAAPILLQRWISKPLAYALPTFFAILLCHWLPRVYSAPESKKRIWLWMLVSVVAAVIYGWMMVK